MTERKKMAEMKTVVILWDYLSPRDERWLEWLENGKTKMKKVTDDFYQSIKARVEQPKQETEDDLSFLE